MSSPKLEPSPGNSFSTTPIEMKIPNLEFIYHLECEMSPDNQPVGAPFGGSHSRLILPIAGGTVKGPHINGTIHNQTGADWATAITGTGLTRLDARYTLKTDDGEHIFVRSKGIFAPHDAEKLAASRSGGSGSGSGEGSGESATAVSSVTQDSVEWFTRLQFDAGPGRYNWMNGIFALGVLSMHGSTILIDAYRVTNFPGSGMKDLKASI